MNFKSFGAQSPTRLQAAIKSFTAGEKQFPVQVCARPVVWNWNHDGEQMRYNRIKSKRDGNTSAKDSGILLWKGTEAACVNMFVQRESAIQAARGLEAGAAEPIEPTNSQWPDVPAQPDNEGSLAADDLLNANENWTATRAAEAATASDLTCSSLAFGEFPASDPVRAPNAASSKGDSNRKGKGQGKGMGKGMGMGL